MFDAVEREAGVGIVVFSGIGVGLLLGPSAGLVPQGLAGILTGWLALPGDLFIRLVQMIMIPLVIASIIQGIAGGGDREKVAKLGTRVATYFVATTLVAILVGVGTALLIQPGAAGALALPAGEGPTPATAPPRGAELPRIISALLPTNPLAAMMSGEMLSIVIFSVIIGAALVSMPRQRAEPVLSMMFAVQEICMTVTRGAMRLAPFAVFGLMTRTTSTSGLSAIGTLGMYVLAVVTALIVILALYAVVLGLFTPVGVGRFFRSSSDVLLLAFSVASSAAVMPLSMKTAEESLDVPPEVSRFVVPLGAIMNMNGTAAYQAVATLFLARVYGLELSLPTLALVVITTVAASIGTPSAPGAGIVVLASVLASAGIPVDGISLILGVDHLLGMCRTSVNVAGDLAACVVFSGHGVAQAPALSAHHPSTSLSAGQQADGA